MVTPITMKWTCLFMIKVQNISISRNTEHSKYGNAHENIENDRISIKIFKKIIMKTLSINIEKNKY